MSALKGLQRRSGDRPAVLLQARVDPEIREAVRDAAIASGVSIAYYVEALVNDMLRENGTLPRVAPPIPQREELPIPAA